MDFWQTVMVVVRRWYIAAPAFLLSILAAVAVYASVPKTFSSTAVLVLTLPTTGASQPADPQRPPDLINPLMNFDKGLSTSAAILIQALSTPETAEALGVPPGGQTWFQVTNGSNNPELLITGPFVFVQGNSNTKTGAMDIVKKVEERARLELANRQKELKAPSSTYITAVEVVPPTTPSALGGSRVRSAAAAAALGLIGGLAATFGFESVMVARAKKTPKKPRKPKQRAKKPEPEPAVPAP
jgi:hypothetical protein